MRLVPTRPPSTSSTSELTPKEAPTLDCTEGEDCRAKAFDRVLALKQQLDREHTPPPDPTTPMPLPEDVEAYIKALDHYVELAEPELRATLSSLSTRC